jgi:pyruvate/2-oxoglutarate dehydrogenase complex dihydrolipoamide dehydrogenase (E3) component
MSLAGGALFGFWAGLVIISFASSIGATLAFLAARFLLRDYVQARFRHRLQTINEGVRKDGAFYLFTLRLVPVFPFFVINLAMALTPIRTRTFYLVSQFGMLPGTVVFVNAGTQLGQIRSTSGILSTELILSFALLGLFPWIAKFAAGFMKNRRALSGYEKPKHFDYNLIVIGGGSAGLVCAYIAATVKAKAALIEKEKMGGDCLNTGCVPSKSLIRSARILSYARRAEDFGLQRIVPSFNFADVMARVHRVIRSIAPHDSVERYTELGVDCIHGEAKITSPYSVEVGGQIYTSRKIIVATGARPVVPPIEGLERLDYLTSENLWGLAELPERLVVLGGGPIGCEMAQAFARFGTQVTQVEMGRQIMGKEDPDVAEFMQKRFEEEGIRVLTGHRATAVKMENGEKRLVCEYDGEEKEIGFDAILLALGRSPRFEGLGLEELGVKIGPAGTIETDPFLRSSIPTIYAAGDAAGPYQFTHVASYQAWFAAVNALFGGIRKFKIDYSVIPWATYTDPEVARVGLNETGAGAAGIDFEVTLYSLEGLDRALTDSENHGFVKVLTRKGRDKILGATIVGYHADILLAELVLAMKHGIGLNKILGTIHPYPTMAEANRNAAGEWKKAHAPEKFLELLERVHRWLRK